MSIDVRDLFPHGGGGPRRPPRGLPVPHPASGTAPDLMDILMEAATQDPKYLPHPDIMDQLDPTYRQGFVDQTNRPDLFGQPEDAMSQAIQLAFRTGGTGIFPALRRTLLQNLADAHISQLDTEAAVHPTMARLLMQDPNAEPTIHDIMDTATEAPKLSSHFQGASVVDNPDVINTKVQELLDRLNAQDPNRQYGDQAAVRDMIAETQPVDEGFDPYIRAQNPDSSGPLRHVLDTIRRLADPNIDANSLVDILAGGGASEDKLKNAVLEAIQTSNIGSGRHVPGMDPSTRASLAPDISPMAMNRQLGPAEDPAMLMSLMGLGATRPRRNV